MAKLTKETALSAASIFCQAIGPIAAVKVVASPRGLSITIDPAGQQSCQDAQKAVADLFAPLDDRAVLGVTADSVSMSIGIIDTPAAPEPNTTIKVGTE